MIDEANGLCDRIDALIQRASESRTEIKGPGQATRLQIVRNSIAQLEKNGAAVPDELCAMEKNLASRVMTASEAIEQLTMLRERLFEALKYVEAHVKGKPFPREREPRDEKPEKPRRARTANPNVTPASAYQAPLIEVLREAGGREQPHHVLSALHDKMKHRLLPGDYEKDDVGMAVWEKKSFAAFYSLRRRKIVHKLPKYGYWELL